MEEGTLNVSKELLNSLSVEQIIDLKEEVDDLVSELDEVIQDCNSALNA